MTDQGNPCACLYGLSPARPSHQQEPGSSPTQHTVENATERLRVDVAVHTDTATAAQLNRHIATLPTGLRRDWRFRGGGLDCRRGLRHDHGHQRARRVRPRFLDSAEFLAPPKELAHVDAGRTGNLGKNRTRLKAGSNQPLFVLARPAPTALDRRDHFNRMLRHRTTPSVCTRTSDVRIKLARRPSPWAYVATILDNDVAVFRRVVRPGQRILAAISADALGRGIFALTPASASLTNIAGMPAVFVGTATGESLTGTTGIDGNITLGLTAAGDLWVENRGGSNGSFRLAVLG